MTARPSPDLRASFKKRAGEEEENDAPKGRNTGQTSNTEFSRIPSAAVPKPRRSFDGYRVLAVARS